MFDFDDLLDQMDAMKKKYGLVDENGCPLKGMPVNKADNMPYNVWRPLDENGRYPGAKATNHSRNRFRANEGTSPWTPSAAERACNTRLAAGMGQNAKSPGRLGGKRLPRGLKAVGPAVGVICTASDAYSGWNGEGKHPGVGGFTGAATNAGHGLVFGPLVEDGIEAGGGGFIYYPLNGGSPAFGTNRHGVDVQMPGGISGWSGGTPPKTGGPDVTSQLFGQ